jgi:predicted lipase
VNGTILAESSRDSLTTGAGLVGLNHKLKAIVVSFRGTYSWRDITTNLLVYQSTADWKSKLQDFLPENNLVPSELRVHAGFELQYVRLRPKIMNATSSLATQYPDYQILFTGHSLGGSLATLAAVDFHDSYGFADRISLYTFGVPRLGDSNWARYVNKLPFAQRMYRFHRKGDPVIRLPFQFMGYEHSLQQYTILDDGSFLKCENENGTGESPACLELDGLSFNVNRHFFYLPPRETRC